MSEDKTACLQLSWGYDPAACAMCFNAYTASGMIFDNFCGKCYDGFYMDMNH